MNRPRRGVWTPAPAVERAEARLAEVQAAGDALAAVLDLLPFGVVVVDSQCRARLANRWAMTAGVARPGRAVGDADAPCTPSERVALRDAIGAVLATLASPDADAIRVVRLHRAEGDLKVVILPLAESLDPLTAAGCAVLIVSESRRPLRFTGTFIKTLYGLTSRECEVAGLMLEGRAAKQIARELDVSVHTARTHVRRVLEKTRTRRQAEVVQLLAATLVQMDWHTPFE